LNFTAKFCQRSQWKLALILYILHERKWTQWSQGLLCVQKGPFSTNQSNFRNIQWQFCWIYQNLLIFFSMKQNVMVLIEIYSINWYYTTISPDVSYRTTYIEGGIFLSVSIVQSEIVCRLWGLMWHYNLLLYTYLGFTL